MTNSIDPEEILRAFAERWRQDRARGIERSLERYLEMFPGDARAIATELLALEDQARKAESADTKTIGPYRTIRELGRGGQGVVYLAEDPRFGRRVALKVLTGLVVLGDEVLARFRREATVASRLDHPGICGVLDAEVEGGVPYIAMPYIEGKTLATQIEESRHGADTEAPTLAAGSADPELVTAPATPTPAPAGRGGAARRPPRTPSGNSVRPERIDELLELFERAARALHAAHEAGVIHRDLKPANLMVRTDGAPILLDFGLAVAEDLDLETLTQSGDLLGTPAYMSPEQIGRKLRRVDRRTDIYSLGVMLFEALTLCRPFESPSREGLFHAILTREAPAIRSLNASVPKDLGVVVAKALEKDRERRYATAEDLAEELRRVRERRPIRARPVGPVVRTQRWAQRNPVVAALLVILIAVLSAATALTAKAAVEARAALAAEQDERRRKESALEAERDARRAEARALAEKSAALAEYDRLADAKRLANAKAESEQLWPVSPELESALIAWQREYAPLFDPATLAGHERALERLRAEATPYSDEERRRDFAPEYEQLAALKKEREQLVAALATEKAPERRNAANKQLSKVRERVQRLEERVRGRRKWAFADAENAFRHEILSQLVSDLRAFTAAGKTDAQRSIAERLARSRRIAELTVSGPEASMRWAEARARIRENPRYRLTPETRRKLGEAGAPAWLFDAEGALDLRPQMGLIPLGPDPRSGLEEFLHLLTHQHDWGQDRVALPARRPITEKDARGGIAVKERTGIVLVLIPAGTFLMGAQAKDPGAPRFDAGAVPNEGAAHEVALAAYFLSKYEITQAQWRRASQSSSLGLDTPSEYGIGLFAGKPEVMPSAVDGTHPVEDVNWTVCRELTRRMGLLIPTEAQWERAARGGHPSQRWPGTDRLEDLSRLANTSGRETAGPAAPWERDLAHQDAYVLHAPVGSFEPNAYGLHDLTGNLWEWCRDNYGIYDHVAPRPHDGLRGGNPRARINRGGSFQHPARFGRSSTRSANAPAFQGSDIGIRPSRRVESE